jgi:hypothetical protein
MANIVTIKRSSVAGKLPNVSDLQVGELALNLADGIIYSKNTVGNVIIVGSSTTSNIREGSNLYFTNARAQAAVANTNIIFANLTTTGNLTVGSGVGGNITGVNNLYATNVYSNVVIANVWSGIYTANVVESTSLYFTNARVVSALTAGFGIVIAANGRLTITATGSGSYDDANTYANVSLMGFATNTRVSALTTTNIPEGSNLYFTNTRTISAFTSGSGISLASNGLITSTATSTGNIFIDYGFIYDPIVSGQQDFGSIA